MAELSKAPAVSGVVIPTADADRINLGLSAAAGILELLRFALQARDYGQAAVTILRARGERLQELPECPEPVSSESIACALHAVHCEIEQARSAVNNRQG